MKALGLLPKILIGVGATATVGYAGLTIAKAIPATAVIIEQIPIISSIPTATDSLADESFKQERARACRTTAEINFRSGASSQNPSWEMESIDIGLNRENGQTQYRCVIKNPNKTEAEWEAYKQAVYDSRQYPITQEAYDGYAEIMMKYELTPEEYAEMEQINKENACRVLMSEETYNAWAECMGYEPRETNI